MFIIKKIGVTLMWLTEHIWLKMKKIYEISSKLLAHMHSAQMQMCIKLEVSITCL